RPHPGARIETAYRLIFCRHETRRPHPGARIETGPSVVGGGPWAVAPSRGRGLNPPVKNPGLPGPRRPHPGARIETAGEVEERETRKSSPPSGGAN
ncbi:MAG: hypothetical protein JJT75_02860, partial [Opitutales bacterium]|nr:hypothetical protein [Opitutales bacterium]